MEKLKTENTVHSARPSSRSSLRSSNSIGSFGQRRPSSAPHSNSKGVLVSTSRSGAARSAAILLISCHISAIKKNKNNKAQNNRMKHLRKQLEEQRQMLHLELPPNTSRILTKILRRGFESMDDETNSLGNGNIEMGALPSPASETARVAVKELNKKYLILIYFCFVFSFYLLLFSCDTVLNDVFFYVFYISSFANILMILCNIKK